jgi:mercuric ion binding protein
VSAHRITSVLAALVVWVVVATAGAQQTTPRVYSLHVDGLACPFCAYGIEKQLSRIEGIESIDMDIETGKVVLTMDDNAALDEPTARKAIDAAGFSLRDFRQVQGAP